MAENSHFRYYLPVNRCANRGNCYVFLTVQKWDGPPLARRAGQGCISAGNSTEARNPFREPGNLPGRRILVDDPAGDSPEQLGLRLFESLRGVGLLASRDGRLDLLDKGPDPADSRMVDDLAIGVAADALLGLRRVRHEFLLGFKMKSGAESCPRRQGRSPTQ